VITAPRYGWELINENNIPSGRVMQGAFIPLLILLGLSCFVPMIYDRTITFSSSLITGIILVSAYSVSYLIIYYLLGGFYPELVKTRGATARLHELVLYSLIYLVLLGIIANVLPINFTPIFFMMTYLVWIVYRGIHYLGLAPSRQTRFLVLASALLLFTPVVITQLLSMLIVK
jgi:hypothetical protein